MKPENTLIQVNRYGMGAGDQDLALQLFVNFIKLSVEENKSPNFIVFYNEGVKLLCSGSPAIEVLKTAEAKGIKLIACKTCLNHYAVTEKMEVGISSTMADIINLQMAASKVITL